MELVRKHILSLPIDNESDIGVCRRKGVNLSSHIGFDKVKTGEIAILISELGTNVLKHGGGKGKIVICEIDENSNKAIEIWCCDSGNGIPNFDRALVDGFTDKESLGIGLGSIVRFSDEIQINPKVDNKEDYFLVNSGFNHCIRTIKWVPKKTWTGTNNNLIIGAASRCHPGENLNGDAYLVNHIGNNITTAAVIDGLGHGDEANLASEKAKKQIIIKSDLSLDNIMNNIHNSIRGTRGAVLGLAKIDTNINKLYFSGIGNIESFYISNGDKKTLLSFGGIMGHNMRTPRVFEHGFCPGDLLCMYSDGITSRWKPSDINWSDSPQKNAELILNNYSRLNDDATILIIRYGS